MSKRYTGNFVVRWVDKENNNKRKVYTDYLLAKQAQKWLTDRGIDNADIAVETQSSAPSMFPAKKLENNTASGNIESND